jgi:phosphoglycolate phosphatase-like HAD superfamily hydrolase
MDYQAILKTFKPGHRFFAGIDSDGCVFDSMEVKQKEFFIPAALRYFDLFRISRQLRETWEFVNLYSIHRGGNRFISLIKVFELLESREDVKESRITFPDLSELRSWVRNENKLGNATLRKYCEKSSDEFLHQVLKWSESVNRDIAEWLHDVPAFPSALAAIKTISSKADIMVVSQTPLEALQKEWTDNRLMNYTNMIAGQEHGTKSEHIALSAKGKYDDDKILMIGDAAGDLDAARSNGILFYPIVPGSEESSWKRFLDEGFRRFISGTFRGSYEESLISDFLRTLPDQPAWKV